MKYIRTKDGIYNIIELDEVWGFLCNNSQTYGDVYIGTDKAIKIAKTIEELFDLIICWQGKQWGFFMPIELEDINKEKWDKIYGVIFTDKGFIYKAKMKGVLPNGEIDWELL